MIVEMGVFQLFDPLCSQMIKLGTPTLYSRLNMLVNMTGEKSFHALMTARTTTVDGKRCSRSKLRKSAVNNISNLDAKSASGSPTLSTCKMGRSHSDRSLGGDKKSFRCMI
jgi:hypothetical protein